MGKGDSVVLATVHVLTTRNNDVNLSRLELHILQDYKYRLVFRELKNSNAITHIGRFYLYCLPLEYHVTLLLSHQS